MLTLTLTLILALTLPPHSHHLVCNPRAEKMTNCALEITLIHPVTEPGVIDLESVLQPPVVPSLSPKVGEVLGRGCGRGPSRLSYRSHHSPAIICAIVTKGLPISGPRQLQRVPQVGITLTGTEQGKDMCPGYSWVQR